MDILLALMAGFLIGFMCAALLRASTQRETLEDKLRALDKYSRYTRWFERSDDEDTR